MAAQGAKDALRSESEQGGAASKTSASLENVGTLAVAGACFPSAPTHVSRTSGSTALEHKLHEIGLITRSAIVIQGRVGRLAQELETSHFTQSMSSGLLINLFRVME
ncbi:MAG: hypothetical protein Q9194_001572 [Teloschistes cf. exilis]